MSAPPALHTAPPFDRWPPRRTAGLEYQPTAKILSLGVVTLLLLAYNKAVDLLASSHPQRSGVATPLFAAVFSCFAAVYLAVAVCLSSTRFGLYGPDGEPLPPSPARPVGWIFYFAVESYGSLSVSLFWQFVNSQVGVKAAKAQYGIIVAGGQVGAIGGCTLVIAIVSICVGATSAVSMHLPVEQRVPLLVLILVEAGIALGCLAGLMFADPGTIKRTPASALAYIGVALGNGC